MTATDYPYPVAALLRYRECHIGENWPDYLGELGISHEHIPVLIDVATNPCFNQVDPESLEGWAPIHAWRALAQLRSEEAVEPLLQLLEDPDNYWAHAELPSVIEEIGISALPAIEKFLSEPSHSNDAHIHVVTCLSSIARKHLVARQACIDLMLKKLEDYQTNGSSLNSYLIEALCQSGATETKSLIKQAFDVDQVDPDIIEREDVEDCLGLL